MRRPSEFHIWTDEYEESVRHRVGPTPGDYRLDEPVYPPTAYPTGGDRVPTRRDTRPWCTLCNEPIDDLPLHMHVHHGWPLDEETPE